MGGTFPIGFEAQYSRAPGLETRVFLPSNLHVIGTMNSADRNIALVDYALRRRFEFIECPPQEARLEATSGTPPVDLRALLIALNARISFLLDADHCIGHGYFMKCTEALDVVEVVARQILPLLREYFYGNDADLLLVLGDREGERFNIHRIERAEESFETVFGVTPESAMTLGYRQPRSDLTIKVDPRYSGTLSGSYQDLTMLSTRLMRYARSTMTLSDWMTPQSIQGVPRLRLTNCEVF